MHTIQIRKRNAEPDPIWHSPTNAGTAPRPVLGIRIRMFSGLPDPHPDPLVTSMDPAPDPAIIKQKKGRKTLISTVL
jgi:hypothetical protein